MSESTLTFNFPSVLLLVVDDWSQSVLRDECIQLIKGLECRNKAYLECKRKKRKRKKFRPEYGSDAGGHDRPILFLNFLLLLEGFTYSYWAPVLISCALFNNMSTNESVFDFFYSLNYHNRVLRRWNACIVRTDLHIVLVTNRLGLLQINHTFFYYILTNIYSYASLINKWKEKAYMMGITMVLVFHISTHIIDLTNWRSLIF